MKTIVRMIAAMTVIALAAMTAACSKPADTSPTAAAPSPATQAATVAATEAPKPTDTAKTAADAPSGATEAAAQAPAESAASDDLSSLTASRWKLTTVEHDGEESGPMYYGSVIRQAGAYLEFNTDNTFNCVLGMTGCEGTYTLADGEVTVNITTVYDGKSDKGYAADDVQTLLWNKEAGTIKLKLNGVTNTFVQE